MNDANCDNLLSKVMRAENELLCPECGAKMTEADRLYESGSIFVWYKCRKNECVGQWLQKLPQQLPKPSIAGCHPSAV